MMGMADVGTTTGTTGYFDDGIVWIYSEDSSGDLEKAPLEGIIAKQIRLNAEKATAVQHLLINAYQTMQNVFENVRERFMRRLMYSKSGWRNYIMKRRLR